MTIDLAKVEFVNDFFSTRLPDGGTIILNLVNEDFIIEDTNEECIVKAINIAVYDYEGNTIDCSCVIGMGNDLLKINTDYKEYEGKVLTPDNMVYCTIEIYEKQ
jgi:hypothetical protein